MDRKELNAINQLFDRLDECLIRNAAMLGSISREANLDDIYSFRDLLDRHYYLKNEYNFAPGEAEALLGFHDPLVVAEACWSETGNGTDVRIGETLKVINAYEQYTLTKAEQDRRNKPQIQQLKARLDQNLADYTAALMEKSKSELVEDSEKIANTKAAYAYMRDSFEYAHGEASLLLQLKDPLKYLASHWSPTFDLSGDDDDTISDIITDLRDPDCLHRAQKAEADIPAQGAKPSVRDQLHRPTKEAGQRPPQEDRPHRKPDVPNL